MTWPRPLAGPRRPRVIAALAAVAWTIPAAGDPVLLVDDARWLGEAPYDESATALAAAGDLNGDGIDDLLIAAPESDAAAADAGQIYVLLGDPGGWSGDRTLADADGSFVGEAAHDYAGYAIDGVGDVDGDGFDDLAIGAYMNDEHSADAGKIYLQLGHAGGWTTGLPLAGADGSWLGEALGDRAGYDLAGVGDVDGDGFDDLLIGGYRSSDGGYYAGEAYLVRGHAGPWPSGQTLDQVDVSFVGESAEDFAGKSVSAAGDVDGDGFDDLLIGAPNADTSGVDAGAAYLVLGADVVAATDVSLGSAHASFEGIAAGDNAGRGLAAAGDVDGDGHDDVLVSAYKADGVVDDVGEVYLLLGDALAWAADVSLATADVTFTGVDEGGYTGWAMATGDMDGDGVADLLLGSHKRDVGETDAGQAALFLGPLESLGVLVPSTEARAVVNGDETFEYLSFALAMADLDGDGHDDLLVGGYRNDAAGTNAGATRVIYGVEEADDDGDGFSTWMGDCDDGDAAIHPGAVDDPCDGIDTDCDGNIDELTDDDGDGFSLCNGECDDGDPLSFPGAAELCDGIDNDCDGAVPEGESDLDGDGARPCDGDCDDDDPDLEPFDLDADGWSTCDGDCDEADATIHPTAVEACNGTDDDCDGVIPDDEFDDDLDGFLPCADPPLGDCDDDDPWTYPGATELCDDLDNDCDGELGDAERDDDGDGFDECAGDCDDGDAGIHPDALEVCGDNVDSDCNGDLPLEVDNDGDGLAECAGDCDDHDPHVGPHADEVCNGGVDDDCDPSTSEYVDLDGDGYSLCDNDCDETDPGTYDGAPEACDGRDNDCNGAVDEGFDQDHDGYSSCLDGDCDDSDPMVRPGMPEIPYDGIDQDCDGDDLRDIDGDGHDGGLQGDDCDDTSPRVFPGAVEQCLDGVDGDCDGLGDLEDPDCTGGGCSLAPAAGDRGGRAGLVWVALGGGVWAARRRRGQSS